MVRKAIKSDVSDISIHCSYDEMIALDKLKPNPRNPNVHPAHQIELLSRIIKSTGWRAVITVSKFSGYIVKGHGRYLAAKLLNMKAVPIDLQNYNSLEEEYSDMLADSRLPEFSHMDDSALLSVLREIDNSNIDLLLSGYDKSMLKELDKSSEEIYESELKFIDAPYEFKTRILISIASSVLHKIKPVLDSLYSIDGIEVEIGPTNEKD